LVALILREFIAHASLVEAFEASLQEVSVFSQ
jgi:hypothetical protein